MAPDNAADDTTAALVSNVGLPEWPSRDDTFKMRLLSDIEMDKLMATARSRAQSRGPEAAIKELWDLILGEAHGSSWDEAVAAGRTYDVAAYEIDADQHTQLGAAIRKRARWDLWFNMAPAIAMDEADDRA